MLAPPSLPADVEARAFRARNGELGIRLEDTGAFLDACEADGVELLGWDLWIVDHVPDFRANVPVPAPGRWGGGIPRRDRTLLSIMGGCGDLSMTRLQLAQQSLDDIEPEWLQHVRVNFTLDDRATSPASA